MSIDYNAIIKSANNLYAHKSKDKNETLPEHIENVKYVFNYLDSEYKILNRLNNSFKNLEITNGKKTFKLSNSSIELINDFFKDAIFMHDLGKINPKFQTDKLSNDVLSFIDTKDVKDIELFIKNPTVNTNHSNLSSLIYLDYYIKEINKLPKSEEKMFLFYILFSFSNIIKAHHTELKSPNAELNVKELKNYLSNIKIFKNYLYFYDYNFDLSEKYGQVFDKIKKYKFDTMTVFIWNKILYSLLVSCDFIATYSFFKGEDVESFTLDNKVDLKTLWSEIEGNDIYKSLLEYKLDKDYYKKSGKPLINELRSSIAIETFDNLVKNKDNRMFMIESPTGSGKTFNSILSMLNLLNEDSKLFYVFPSNTLSYQTKCVIDEIFNGKLEMQEINSIAPLPLSSGTIDYQKVLLDRQLLNYKSVITSNITLFNVLFSNKREHSMGLFSLFNSVIILDEIQNYKNSIWKETIEFLYRFSEILNIKIIIMSATLPNLDELIGFSKKDFTRLIENPSIYYKNPLFKDRVNIDRSLLDVRVTYGKILTHLIKAVEDRDKLESCKSKVMIEFITKKSCREFKEYAASRLKDWDIYHLDSDTNSYKKENIINSVKVKGHSKNILLCTTQVVEAGVDIDMDIGYKDAVFPDVDEQFLGRINRSATKTNCSAFFFNLDSETFIYKGDYRLYSNISNDNFFECLKTKDFKPLYSDYVFKKIEDLKIKGVLSTYDKFINDTLKMQNFKEISDFMRLIDNNTFTIFIPTIVNGIDGADVWKNYNEILLDKNYARRRINLINLRKEMNYFTYSVYGNGLEEVEPVGGIYYIEDGDDFIDNETFDSVLFKNRYIIIK